MFMTQSSKLKPISNGKQRKINVISDRDKTLQYAWKKRPLRTGTYLERSLLDEYDYLNKIIQIKNANHDNCEDSNYFSLIKDSLTLISTKLNVIKEEESSSSPLNLQPTYNENESMDNKISDLNTHTITDDSSGYYSCISSPKKEISFESMDFFEKGELILSCNVSETSFMEQETQNGNFYPKNPGLAETNVKKFDYIKNIKDESLLDNLLDMTHTDVANVNHLKQEIGLQCNAYKFVLVKSHSQQTDNSAKQLLDNNIKHSQNFKPKTNIIRKISKANQTVVKTQKRLSNISSLKTRVHTTKKEYMTSGGDCLEKTKSPTVLNKIKRNDKKRSDSIPHSKNIRRNITGLKKNYMIYIPHESHDTNNLERTANLTVLKKYIGQNDYSNKLDSSNKAQTTTDNKNTVDINNQINDTSLKQDEVLEIQDSLLKGNDTEIKLKISNPKFISHNANAATESVMKIVLGRKDSNMQLDLEYSIPFKDSISQISDTDKSDSRVFAVDSTLFFKNAYRVFIEKNNPLICKKSKIDDDLTVDSGINDFKQPCLKSVSSNTIKKYSCIQLKQSDEKLKSNSHKMEYSENGTKKSHTSINESLSRHSDSRDILTIYTKPSEETYGGIFPAIQSSLESKHVYCGANMADADEENNFTINELPLSDSVLTSETAPVQLHQHIEKITNSKESKNIEVNTVITMKKKNLVIKSNTSLQVKNNSYSSKTMLDYDNSDVPENLHNMLKYFVTGSNVEVNTLSTGSSFTFYNGKKLESTNSFLKNQPNETTLSSFEHLTTRRLSSEQFIREISNINHTPHNLSSNRFYRLEIERQLSTVINYQNKDECKSLYENRSQCGTSTVQSSLPISEVDSFATFSSSQRYSKKMQPLLLLDLNQVSIKNCSINSMESIVNQINNLAFMSHECEWQRRTDDLWQFKLLNGRLILILRLDSSNQSSSECKRRILSIGLHKYVIHRKKNSLSAHCVKFVGESIRHCISTRKWDRFGQVPEFLSMCRSFVKLGLKWEQDMRDTKTRLGYELDNNSLLSLKVTNSSLSTVWHVTQRLELRKDHFKSWAWPEVKDFCFIENSNNRTLAQGELLSKLGEINHDWDHVPHSLWTIYDYLRHKQSHESQIAPHRILNKTPTSVNKKICSIRLHAIHSTDTNLNQGRSYASLYTKTPSYIW